MQINFDWAMRPNAIDPPLDSILSYAPMGVPKFINDILERRAYLTVIPSLDNSTGIESDLNQEMWQIGADRISQAILQDQHIHIFGDFDVDGCTSTCCMLYTLYKLGVDVSYSIADRLGKGHGIDVAQITLDAPKGSLIVTVDNGTSSINEVSELIEQGYDVLITDHHLPDGGVADTLIVNPKISLDEANQEYMVPGVYVSAKLACMISRNTPRYEEIASYCHALTAMGIISDIISINDLIRRELTYGLIELQCIQHAGIQALLGMCGAKPAQPLTSKFLSYTVLPKLNAAGRMGTPHKAIDLLLHVEDKTPNQEIATLQAMQLKHINEERKLLEQNIYLECTEEINTWDKLPEALVMYKPQWHPGILGIIASRLVEDYGVPVLMIAKREGILFGSGRGIEGFDLYDALQKCQDLLLGFGGHRVAAGMQLKEENLPTFKEKFIQEAEQQLRNISVTIEIDAEVTLRDIQDVNFFMFLENLQPVGKDNPEVILLVRNCEVIEAYEKRQAYYLAIKDDTGLVITISKFRPSDKFKLQVGDKADVLITPSPTYFSGITNIEWRMIDVRKL